MTRHDRMKEILSNKEARAEVATESRPKDFHTKLIDHLRCDLVGLHPGLEKDLAQRNAEGAEKRQKDFNHGSNGFNGWNFFISCSGKLNAMAPETQRRKEKEDLNRRTQRKRRLDRFCQKCRVFWNNTAKAQRIFDRMNGMYRILSNEGGRVFLHRHRLVNNFVLHPL